MLCAVEVGAQKSQFFVIEFLWGHTSSQFIKPCKIVPAFMGGLGVAPGEHWGRGGVLFDHKAQGWLNDRLSLTAMSQKAFGNIGANV